MLLIFLEGPMIFAPLSELYGRRIMYVTTLLVGVVFIIPGAVSKNIATILVARAIDGIGFRRVGLYPLLCA